MAMSKVAMEPMSVAKAGALFHPWPRPRSAMATCFACQCQSMQGRHSKVYKELGLFTVKKNIEDAVNRAEMIAPALELEEARRIKQERVLREYNLWDDLARSNESLTALTDAIKLVNGLKDMRLKVQHNINNQISLQAYSAGVDVIPLFLGKAIDLQIDDKDLEISSPSPRVEQCGYRMDSVVAIHHIPSGVTIQCSGERSHFANKAKALNRLKGKLLVLAMEHSMPDTEKTRRDDAKNFWEPETRVYTIRPQKSVHDLRTGVHLSDLNSWMATLNHLLELISVLNRADRWDSFLSL